MPFGRSEEQGSPPVFLPHSLLVTPSTDSHRWRAIGDLDRLLQPEALLADLRSAGLDASSAKANYIRLKPGSGALLGLELDLRLENGDTVTLPAYLRTHDADRTAQLVRKWHPGRAVPTPFGDGVRLLPGGRSALFLFPNDAAVRGMRFVAQLDKLKRALGTLPAVSRGRLRVRGRRSILHTVRYKPERRLILRAGLRLKDDASGDQEEQRLFLRFFTDDRGARLSRWSENLHAGPLGAVVPQPYGALLDGRLLVEEDVEGRPLYVDVLHGSAPADRLAEVVCALHRTPLSGLPSLDSDVLLRRATEIGRNLRFVAPHLAPRIERLLGALRAAAPTDGVECTVHGDLHMHQFLVTRSDLVVVDFERAGRGDPLLDLGHLTAHALLLEHREPDHAAAVAEFRHEVTEGVLARTPGSRAASVPFFVGLGLLERALLPFRRLERDWEDRCGAVLDIALEQLDARLDSAPPARPAYFARAAFGVFHPRPDAPWPGHVVGRGNRRRYGEYLPASDRFAPIDPLADPRLPALASWLSRGELVTYRVGRRATVRLEQERSFAKVVRPRRASSIAVRYRAMHEARYRSTDGFPRVPRLAHCDEEAGVLVMDQLPGTPLHRLLTAPVPVADAALAAVGRGLAAFHSHPADPRLDAHHRPPPRPLPTWIELVAPHDPALSARCAQVAETIPPPREGVRAIRTFVHGDLHDRNILIDGPEIGLLDLDQLGLGSPTEDVGNLAAHFVLRALQAGRTPEDGWADARRLIRALRVAGARHDGEEVASATARTLVRLACVYRFRDRWSALAFPLVDEARHAAESLEGVVFG